MYNPYSEGAFLHGLFVLNSRKTDLHVAEFIDNRGQTYGDKK